MHHHVVRRSLVAVAALVATACSSSNEPVSANLCQGDLSVLVSAGTSPTISWSPACAGNGLTVEVANPSHTSAAWAITSNSSFAAPVSYGVLPANATNVVPLVSLVPGTTYRVTVMRTVGEVVIASQGSTTFVP